MIEPAVGKFENGNFLYPIRVYYEDTDAEGVVYHVNYLKYIERSGIEFLRALNISPKDMPFAMVIRRLEIDYKSFAFLDDALNIEVKPIAIEGIRVKMQYKIFNLEQKLLMQAVADVVIVDIKSKRPMRLPDDLRSRIEKHL